MERSYNVFVDNGLYVLGYYLNKSVEDITIEDIIGSTSMMANKLAEYHKCELYKDNISRSFYNSSYTQSSRTLPDYIDAQQFIKDNNSTYTINKKRQIVVSDKYSVVKYQYDTILNNIGSDDYCSICGEMNVADNITEEYESMLSRSLMPQLHGNTFMNYTNNLQKVNVCPICLYLSMLSLFNTHKPHYELLLYNSDDDEFMEDMTYNNQLTLTQNMSIQVANDIKYTSNNEHIKNTIIDVINKQKIYNGYIQVIRFCNGGQNECYAEDIISNKDMKFINGLMNKSLLAEFELTKQFHNLITGKLQRNYITCVCNLDKSELKVSEELLCEIEEVYCMLSKDKIQLIKTICNDVFYTNNKDEITQLKSITTLKAFQMLLLKWSEEYNKKCGENLFNDISDYDTLCNYKEFITIKNIMLMQFIILNNKNKGEDNHDKK